MNISTTISLYESAIKELDLLIHAQRERVKAVIAKYDGYASEEVNEVTHTLKELERNRGVEAFHRDQLVKAEQVNDFMIRTEDDEF
jgi:hypothetical protein